MRTLLPAPAALVITLAACSSTPTAVGPELEPRIATAPAAPAAAALSVTGRFIVTLRQQEGVVALMAAQGVRPDFVYTHALNGFAGSLSEAAHQRLLRDPRVVRIEPDRVARIMETESNATWGLDRVDQRGLPLSGSYTYRKNGSGVRAYIIDSGLRVSHVEFGGRAMSGFDAVDGGSANDCNGHGTHVAGTVGGARYGIAQAVTLVGVRVLNCDGLGTYSGVLAGIDWITRNARRPAVATMSLGGPPSNTLDNAVRKMIAAGIAVVVAAGNDRENACGTTPARVTEAMTIGASTRTDRRADFSNYGSCLDWFAPGAGITSAWHSGNSAIRTISGTSMAVPHVAGVAALYLQGNPGASANQVRNALYAKTTKGIVGGARSANNHLLFTNY
jgi:aqualysin 1